MSRHLTPMRIRTADPRVTRAALAPVAECAGVTPLLRLLHLASPALPIGAFHFSQGLEYAVEAGWVRDEPSALEWIGGIAEASVATLDLPVLARLHAAWTACDAEAVMRWNAFLIACRETEELRAEDRHLGAALFRVLSELELKTELFPLDPPRSASPRSPQGVAHATAFAFACASWGIDAGSTLQTYLWAWIENQVLAAVKLVPLGQSAAQRMLHALASRIPRSVERAHKLTDSDIGISTALSAVASGRHEAQYSRLFRS
jgi:urease accessory protein